MLQTIQCILGNSHYFKGIHDVKGMLLFSVDEDDDSLTIMIVMIGWQLYLTFLEYTVVPL